MDSGTFVCSEDQARILAERYANGTLEQMGPEWLGEYYEDHPRDHARDLERALHDYLQHVDQDDKDELRGLSEDAARALEVLEGRGVAAPRPSFSAPGSDCDSFVDTPSFYCSSMPGEVHSQEPDVFDVVVGSLAEQRLVEVRSSSGSLPEPKRRCQGRGLCRAIKCRVGALWLRKWWPSRKKEAEENDNAKPGLELQEAEKKRKRRTWSFL